MFPFPINTSYSPGLCRRFSQSFALTLALNLCRHAASKASAANRYASAPGHLSERSKVWQAAGPEAIWTWHGVDYLAKMASDLDFLCQSSPSITAWLGLQTEGNPFLLPSQWMSGRHAMRGAAHAVPPPLACAENSRRPDCVMDTSATSTAADRQSGRLSHQYLPLVDPAELDRIFAALEFIRFQTKQ